MNTTSLYAIKTDSGYGLFQYFRKTVMSNRPFYLIYNNQIPSFEKIADALSGDYYYLRLIDDLLPIVKDMDNSSSEKQVTYSLSGMTYYDADYRNCHVAYLGEYELPPNAILPRYSRYLELNFITGKHSWSKVDEYDPGAYHVGGKSYKTITPEIEDYPCFYGESPTELLKFFNLKLTIKDFNDAYVDGLVEERYLQQPYLRPSKEAYDDIKRPLPTDGWRRMLENPDAESEYLEFCDKIEGSLDEFLESIDNNRRSAKAPLVILIRALNKIANDTGLIGTLERETLYDYIVRVLKSLKKPTLIDTIDELRDW
ncbi:MAG: hypothetical protein LBE09_06470 [Christensenellaceae bacterium]|jgi:hypothetical protein|nr:hypothetical protein [Christensenellaceae bacterium]